MSATRPAGLLAGVLGAAGLVVSAAVVVSAEPAPAPNALPSALAVVPAQTVEPPRDRSATPPVTGPVTGPATGPITGRAARAVSPVGLAIAAVGFSAPVRPVGATGEGQMALPADPRVLGWYRFGPSIGPHARGSAVLAGHLDSVRFGLGPLVRLRDVRPGDRVRVVGSDGSLRAFVVRRVDRYDRRSLPAELFARRGPLRLRIITCGGAYDADRGGYQQNLVVTATPTPL